MSQCTRYTIHPQALGEYHLDKHRLGEGPPVGQEPHQAQQPQAKVSSWFALITMRLPGLAMPAGLWSLNPLAGVLGGTLLKYRLYITALFQAPDTVYSGRHRGALAQAQEALESRTNSDMAWGICGEEAYCLCQTTVGTK